MRVALDRTFMVAEYVLLVGGALFVWMTVVAYFNELRMAEAIEERWATNPLKDKDYYYFVRHQYVLWSGMLTATTAVGVGGILHWLRKLLRERVQEAT